MGTVDQTAEAIIGRDGSKHQNNIDWFSAKIKYKIYRQKECIARFTRKQIVQQDYRSKIRI